MVAGADIRLARNFTIIRPQFLIRQFTSVRSDSSSCSAAFVKREKKEGKKTEEERRMEREGGEKEGKKESKDEKWGMGKKKGQEEGKSRV